MISSISVSNFKSINSCENIQLSPLTIVIGPNGAGKSNFLKVIQLIGTMHKVGLARTLARFGGFHEVLPKWLSIKDASGSTIKLQYKFRLDNQLMGGLVVDHILEVGKDGRLYKVLDESIRFSPAFEWLKQVIETNVRFRKDDPTYATLTRSADGPILFNTNFNFSNSRLELLKEWFGPFISNTENANELSKLVQSFTPNPNTPRFSRRSHLDTILDIVRTQSNPYQFIMPLSFFRYSMGSTNRFDLLIDKLRTEQPFSFDEELQADGGNITGAWRKIQQSGKKSGAISRIRISIQELAPHIDNVHVSKLESTSEFIAFAEKHLRYRVGSWDTSDGTLRALAILVAIERQPPGTTIIIEEPELNLHPWAISTLLNHIRGVIAANKIQVILSTHSPELLSAGHPGEVLIVDRNSEGHTLISRLADNPISQNITPGELGVLWTKGLLRGIPNG